MRVPAKLALRFRVENLRSKTKIDFRQRKWPLVLAGMKTFSFTVPSFGLSRAEIRDHKRKASENRSKTEDRIAIDADRFKVLTRQGEIMKGKLKFASMFEKNSLGSYTKYQVYILKVQIQAMLMGLLVVLLLDRFMFTDGGSQSLGAIFYPMLIGQVFSIGISIRRKAWRKSVKEYMLISYLKALEPSERLTVDISEERFEQVEV